MALVLCIPVGPLLELSFLPTSSSSQGTWKPFIQDSFLFFFWFKCRMLSFFLMVCWREGGQNCPLICWLSPLLLGGWPLLIMIYLLLTTCPDTWLASVFWFWVFFFFSFLRKGFPPLRKLLLFIPFPTRNFLFSLWERGPCRVQSMASEARLLSSGSCLCCSSAMWASWHSLSLSFL